MGPMCGKEKALSMQILGKQLVISPSGASQASPPYQLVCGDKGTLQTKIEKEFAEWSGV